MTAECNTIENQSATNPEDVCPGATGAADDATCGTGCGSNQPADRADQEEEQYIELLGKLPPEIGTMLIAIGIAGILLPGPIGTPMLIAGALVYWPQTFAPIERALAKRCPGIHREGVIQIKRFISDLNRRFPDNR